MASTQSESSFKRRTSERRRLKLLKNIDEYKIPNPYRINIQETPLPDELSQQLKKVDYLSPTSINMLAFVKMQAEAYQSLNMLQKMGQALRSQQEKFQILFGNQDTAVNSQESAQVQQLSAELHKQNNIVQEMIQTKGEISEYNIFDPQYPIHDNIFECHSILEEEDLMLLESRNQKTNLLRDCEELVLNNQYENYFVN